MITEFERSPGHSHDSVSFWLGQVKNGQHRPVAKLFTRYFPRLVALATSRLRNQPRLLAYAEDVALSAFHTLCSGAEKGRFPNLTNRRSLWQLLAVITVRKAIDLQRKERSQPCTTQEHIGSLKCPAPSPESAAIALDQVHAFLNRLRDNEVRQLVKWKMIGFSNEEISGKTGCSVRTIERKLQRIRQQLQGGDCETK